MAVLSEKHRDGWGLAAANRLSGWTVHRGLQQAARDGLFHDLATATIGEITVAHVRQRTRGAITLENTHPFVADPWVFAHNGTVGDTAFLRAGTSQKRLAQIRGDTDSERLLAFLLTRIDDAAADRDSIDRALRAATLDLTSRREFGTASFLLSDGNVLYAHRFGAPLHLLERTGGTSECPDCRRAPCIAITTEPITDEGWLELRDRDLLRIDRDPTPRWTYL
jgi:predicted glutamine amidotransferase